MTEENMTDRQARGTSEEGQASGRESSAAAEDKETLTEAEEEVSPAAEEGSGTPGAAVDHETPVLQEQGADTQDGLANADHRGGACSGRGDFRRGMLCGALICTTVVLAILLTARLIRRNSRQQDVTVLTSSQLQEKLGDVQEVIAQYYLNDVDGQELEDWLFKGVAAGLDDPYAAYYTAEESQEVKSRNQGTYEGIGITYMADDQGRFIVVSVYDNSPAAEAGIEAGDQIVSVSGTDVTGMASDEISDLIGSQKDGMTIGLLRGDEEITVELALSTVELTSVTGEMETDTIGYIRIEEFDTITVEQFEGVLQDLESQGMTKMIIDLRDNPGGTLLSVTNILDDLLDECLIVSTKTRSEEEDRIYAEDGKLFDGEMAVLVNGSSASASEIFAGTVQDYGLGPIIGQTTYGKGVVQQLIPLGDGSYLKLTTEKYYTAAGRDIDGTGITPDIELEEDEDALQKAIEELSSSS